MGPVSRKVGEPAELQSAPEETDRSARRGPGVCTPNSVKMSSLVCADEKASPEGDQQVPLVAGHWGSFGALCRHCVQMLGMSSSPARIQPWTSLSLKTLVLPC